VPKQESTCFSRNNKKLASHVPNISTKTIVFHTRNNAHTGLNTCIGKANYRQFYRLMWALVAMEVMHLILHVYLILDILLDGTFASPYRNKIVLVVIFFSFLLFNVLSIILIGQLIVFHMNLQQKRLTTYEYIILEHKEKRELARRLGDLEAKRIAMIDQSRGVSKCFLQMGGFCRNLGVSACDPLELPPVYIPDPEAGFAAAIGPARNTELASIAPRETPPAPLTANEDEDGREGKIFDHGDDDDDDVDDENHPPGRPTENGSRMSDNNGAPPQQYEEYPPSNSATERTQELLLNNNSDMTTRNGPPDTGAVVVSHMRESASRQQDWDDYSMATTSVVPDVFENEPLDERSHHSSTRRSGEMGVRPGLSSC
jgi:DHHC palmitoyltransferase